MKCYDGSYPLNFYAFNIEMTPLCKDPSAKIEVTLPRVLGSREVRFGGGVVDKQLGVRLA